jgi:glycerate kinase
MKIVIAPQTFKGSISALDVAAAMAEGVRRVVPDADTDLVPVADGGDGTLETLVEATGGEVHTAVVTGPLGDTVEAGWGALGDGRTAVVEMARTSGLALVPPDKRDPLAATTRGLGEIIAQALDAGFRSFIVGIGGSATNDAGAGMAQALGVRLLDSQGNDLPPGGAALARLDRIDMSGLDPRARESTFSVACDVSNPLTGPEGASAVYGPQKGATPEMVAQLDAALSHLADVAGCDLGKSISDVAGAGAAGGLGGGMIAFLGGALRAGVDIVLDAVDLRSHLEGADLVITGEGQLDFQTVYNKAPIGVARLAKERGIPVIAVSGSLGKGFTDVHEHGIDAALAITPSPMTLEESSSRARELAASAAEQAIRLMSVGPQVFSTRR